MFTTLKFTEPLEGYKGEISLIAGPNLYDIGGPLYTQYEKC